MRVKTIVNSKGEPYITRTEIPIEVAGGELGKKAVVNLCALIKELQTMKTEQDVLTHYLIISGFAACCEVCGFMTEESTNDLIHMAERLVENRLEKIKEGR